MKITEGHTIIFKLVCFLTIPACSVFVALLKPHVETGTWPNGVAWWCAIVMAIANICNAGLAFSSGSFAKWQEKNGSTINPAGQPTDAGRSAGSTTSPATQVVGVPANLSNNLQPKGA